MDSPGDIRTLATTALAPILWGTTYITVTHLLPGQSPLVIAAMRVLPAGLAFVAWRWSATRWHPHRGDWWPIILIGTTNFALFFPLLTVAVQRLPGGVAAAVGGIQPLLVVALTAVLNRRYPGRRELFFATVAAAGVALVVIRPGAAFDAVGLLAALGANVSFAIGVVASKHLPPAPDRIGATGYQFLVASVVLVPSALVIDGPPHLGARDLIGFAYLGVIATALAFVFWFDGVRRLPTPAPPLLGLLAPLTGTLIGWAALSQSMSPMQVVGIAITMTAIAGGAHEWGARRHPSAPHPRWSWNRTMDRATICAPSGHS